MLLYQIKPLFVRLKHPIVDDLLLMLLDIGELLNCNHSSTE